MISRRKLFAWLGIAPAMAATRGNAENLHYSEEDQKRIKYLTAWKTIADMLPLMSENDRAYEIRTLIAAAGAMRRYPERDRWELVTDLEYDHPRWHGRPPEDSDGPYWRVSVKPLVDGSITGTFSPWPKPKGWRFPENSSS